MFGKICVMVIFVATYALFKESLLKLGLSIEGKQNSSALIDLLRWINFTVKVGGRHSTRCHKILEASLTIKYILPV